MAPDAESSVLYEAEAEADYAQEAVAERASSDATADSGYVWTNGQGPHVLHHPVGGGNGHTGLHRKHRSNAQQDDGTMPSKIMLRTLQSEKERELEEKRRAQESFKMTRTTCTFFAIRRICARGEMALPCAVSRRFLQV